MKQYLLTCLAAGALLATTSQVQAQNNALPNINRYCSTDSMTEKAMKEYPEYAKGRKAFTEYVKSLDTSPNAAKMAAATYTIPVVVHVMHTYGSDNISDAQAIDAIRIVNEDFNKLNADTGDVTNPDFSSIYANVGIEFKLAKLDPNGNPTNGITHTYTPLTNSAGENVKSIIGWDGQKYLNIWVVENIASGSGGYSYLPCGVPQNREGIVVRNTQFGGIGRSSGGNFSKRTLTHEIGHYLGLPHTWGGSNTPGVATNCSIDDNIQDTPNTAGTTGQVCNLNQNTCGAGTPGDLVDNVQNYMDYSNCAKMFTNGQKAVMVGSLMTQWCRNILSTPNNLTATGTAPGFTNLSAPKADFTASKTRICEGSTITYYDQSYNTVIDNTVTHNWSFPGGTPSTSTLQNPTVIYATPGTYSATLTVNNPAGTSPKTKTNFVTVVSQTSGEVAPFTYSFENPTFPANGTNPVKDWSVESNSTTSWEQTSDAAYDGTRSIKISHQSIPKGTVNTLYSANIIKNASAPKLKFKVAYKQRSGSGVTSNDELRIALSPNCGATWYVRYTKIGSALSTSPGAIPYTFIPNSQTQWREEVLDLFAGIPQSNTVLVRFESTSDNGNVLYVDDIRVEGTVSGVADIVNSAKLDVYPNPSDGSATIRFDLEKSADVALEIVNIAGQRIGYKTVSNATAGQHEVKLTDVAEKLPAGIYFVRVNMNGHTFVKKAFVF